MGAGYKGNRTVYGSWLMDENALRGLENMATNIFNYLLEVQDRLLEDFPEDSRYKYLKDTTHHPQIEVWFTDSSKINGNTFQEIFDLLEIRQRIPQKVIVWLKCLGTEVVLTLSSGKVASNYFKYEVIGNEKYDNYEACKNVVIGKIENWIDENKPDLLLLVWYNLSKWSNAAIVMLLVFIWLVISVCANNKEYYFDSFESEIIKIVENGITDANRDRALELILLRQYDIVPKSWVQQNNEAGSRIILNCIWGVLLCLFVRISPKSNFSIGKGKKRVKFWNQYRRFMFVVIPTVIIIPVLINIFV